MNTFFKTFFVCLFLTLGLLAYKFFSDDSYSSALNTSKTSTVFGVHEDIKDAPSIEQKEVTKTAVQEDIKPDVKPIEKSEARKFEHKCYFYSNNGELVMVKRKLAFAPSLENAINVLLKGPLISEAKKGIYSEIPANVDLISITRLNGDVVIDLSSNFGNGGGSKSIANRVSQVSKTAKLYEPNKNIYLYIDGKEVEYLGGDGVYIKQPLD